MSLVPPLYTYGHITARTFVERRTRQVFNAIVTTPHANQAQVDWRDIYDGVIVLGIRSTAASQYDEQTVMELTFQRVRERLAAEQAASQQRLDDWVRAQQGAAA